MHRNVIPGDMCPARVHGGMAILLYAPGRRRTPPRHTVQLRMAALHALPAHRPRHPAGPHLRHDARRHHHRILDGTRLQLGIHARGKRIPALLRLPLPLQLLHAGTRRGHQHLPDVHLLGTGGSILLPADRLLLHQTRGRRRLQESLHRHPLRRPRLPDRHPAALLLHENILVRTTDLGRHLPLCRGCRNNLHGMLRHELGHGLDLHGRCREIGHVPATHLAARRHGRTDTRVGIDPRGHHGRCRSLPRGPLVPRLLL